MLRLNFVNQQIWLIGLIELVINYIFQTFYLISYKLIITYLLLLHIYNFFRALFRFLAIRFFVGFVYFLHMERRQIKKFKEMLNITHYTPIYKCRQYSISALFGSLPETNSFQRSNLDFKNIQIFYFFKKVREFQVTFSMQAHIKSVLKCMEEANFWNSFAAF